MLKLFKIIAFISIMFAISSAHARQQCLELFNEGAFESESESAWALQTFLSDVRRSRNELPSLNILDRSELQVAHSISNSNREFNNSEFIKIGGPKGLTILVRRKNKTTSLAVITPSSRINFKNLVSEIYAELKSKHPQFQIAVFEDYGILVPKTEVRLPVNRSEDLYDIVITEYDRVSSIMLLIQALDKVSFQ